MSSIEGEEGLGARLQKLSSSILTSSDLYQVIHEVSPSDAHGTHEATVHGPREPARQDVLPCQVQTRDAYIRTHLGDSLEGEAGGVVVGTVHLPLLGA